MSSDGPSELLQAHGLPLPLSLSYNPSPARDASLVNAALQSSSPFSGLWKHSRSSISTLPVAQTQHHQLGTPGNAADIIKTKARQRYEKHRQETDLKFFEQLCTLEYRLNQQRESFERQIQALNQQHGVTLLDEKRRIQAECLQGREEETKELEKAKTDLQDSLDTAQLKHRGDVARFNQIIVESKKAHGTLQSRLLALTQENNVTTSNLLAKSKEVDTLNAQLEQLRTDNQLAMEAHAVLASSKANSEREFGELRLKNQGHEEKLSSLNAILDGVKDELRSYRSEKDAIADRLVDKENEMRRQANEAQSRIETLRKDQHAAELQRDKNRDELNRLRTEMSLQQKKSNGYLATLSANTDKIKALEAQRRKFKDGACSEQAKVKQLRESLEVAKQKLFTMSEEVSRLENEARRSQAELETAKSEITTVYSRIAAGSTVQQASQRDIGPLRQKEETAQSVRPKLEEGEIDPMDQEATAPQVSIASHREENATSGASVWRESNSNGTTHLPRRPEWLSRSPSRDPRRRESKAGQLDVPTGRTRSGSRQRSPSSSKRPRIRSPDDYDPYRSGRGDFYR